MTPRLCGACHQGATPTRFEWGTCDQCGIRSELAVSGHDVPTAPRSVPPASGLVRRWWKAWT